MLVSTYVHVDAESAKKKKKKNRKRFSNSVALGNYMKFTEQCAIRAGDFFQLKHIDSFLDKKNMCVLTRSA